MTLTNESYLEIEAPEGEATFQLKSNQTFSETVEKSYLVGGRGQYISEVNQLLREPADFSVASATDNRRAGRWLDGGAGQWSGTIAFTTGHEDVTWGDGSGGTGPSNVTETDASGADVKPISRMQVLSYWIANTKSDSFAQTRLHVGEWTDGTVGSSSGGAFGHPLPIAIQSFQAEKQEDETASFNGTLEYAQVTPFSEFVDGVGEWLTEDVAGAIPDIPDE